MDKDTRLKLAVQKSGRLTDHSLDLLGRCGLKLSRGKDQLMGFGENLPLDVLFVRDDDIPDRVQEDVCDLGMVGLNVLEERRLEMAASGASARFEILRRLDFGRCRLSLAVPEGMAWKDLSSIGGLRIATTYPALLGDFLQRYWRDDERLPKGVARASWRMPGRHRPHGDVVVEDELNRRAEVRGVTHARTAQHRCRRT
jgi:ATP phosphoribosyltransferase